MKNYLAPQYIKKYQQGGLTTFSPNPQPYRNTIQGVDPRVLQYDVNTAPVDTSALIQVMQTKNNLDLQRERLAVEREEMALKKEMQKKQIEFEEAKIMNTLMKDIFKMDGGGSAYGKDGNPIYFNGDLSTTKRFAPAYAKAQAEEDLAMQEFVKIASGPDALPTKQMKMLQINRRVQNIRKSIPSLTEMQADVANYNKVLSVYGDPESKVEVNDIVLNNWVKQREDYLNGVDNGYQLTKLPEGLYYDKKSTTEALDKLKTTLTTPHYVEDVELDGRMVKQTRTGYVLNNEGAANQLATSVLSDVSLLSAISNRYQIDLFNTDPENRKKILLDTFRKEFAADDVLQQMQTMEQETFKGQIPSNDPRVNIFRYENLPEKKSGGTHKFIYEGTVNRNETRKTEVSGGQGNTIKVDYSGNPDAATNDSEAFVMNNAGKIGIGPTSVAKRAKAIAITEELMLTNLFNPSDERDSKVLIRYLTNTAPDKYKVADITKLLKDDRLSRAKKAEAKTRGSIDFNTGTVTYDGVPGVGAAPTQSASPKKKTALEILREKNKGK